MEHIIKELDNLLEDWIKPLDILSDKDSFKFQLHVCVYSFNYKIVSYSKTKESISKHANQDYLADLSDAVNNCKTLLDFLISEHPILNNHHKENKKQAEQITQTYEYLVNVLNTEYEKKEQSFQTLRNRYDVILEGKRKYKTLSNSQKINYQKYVESFDGYMDDFEKIHNPYKIINRSELRTELVYNLATIYKKYTSRNDLKRTSEEIAARKKSPFKQLVEICFNVSNERVEQGTLKKLLAEINKRE